MAETAKKEKLLISFPSDVAAFIRDLGKAEGCHLSDIVTEAVREKYAGRTVTVTHSASLSAAS